MEKGLFYDWNVQAKKVMREKGISQVKLAELIGQSSTSVCVILGKNGAWRSARLKISEVLGIAPPDAKIYEALDGIKKEACKVKVENIQEGLFYDWNVQAKKVMYEKGISQAKLAELIGQTSSGVCAILRRNDPCRFTRLKISEVLGIAPPDDQLFEASGSIRKGVFYVWNMNARKAMNEQGLTTYDLADLLGISPSYISGVLGSNASRRVIRIKISKILGIDKPDEKCFSYFGM